MDQRTNSRRYLIVTCYHLLFCMEGAAQRVEISSMDGVSALRIPMVRTGCFFFSPSTLRTKKDSVALLTETQVEMEHSQ